MFHGNPAFAQLLGNKSGVARVRCALARVQAQGQGGAVAYAFQPPGRARCCGVRISILPAQRFQGAVGVGQGWGRGFDVFRARKPLRIQGGSERLVVGIQVQAGQEGLAQFRLAKVVRAFITPGSVPIIEGSRFDAHDQKAHRFGAFQASGSTIGGQIRGIKMVGGVQYIAASGRKSSQGLVAAAHKAQLQAVVAPKPLTLARVGRVRRKAHAFTGGVCLQLIRPPGRESFLQFRARGYLAGIQIRQHLAGQGQPGEDRTHLAG